MNSLSRALSQFASSQQTRERVLVHSSRTLQSFSTTTTKKWNRYYEKGTTTKTLQEPSSSPSPSSEIAADSDWPRPTEIPFQPKVANSINLIGYVHMAVQSKASPDGKYWAGTIISQDPTSKSRPLWIPVIFEGDLAHIAALHLKENDHIFVTGELRADPPPLNVTQGRDQANVQVMVHSVNFVQGSYEMKKSSARHELEDGILRHSASITKDGDPTLSSWTDLLDSPQQWWDFRRNKLHGTVKPKFPDFKRKDGSQSIWLNRAPLWVISKLEGVEFDQIQKSNPTKKRIGDETWKDLVENPNKWWDNRLGKKNGRAPDFKHKETGEVLWLSDAPQWVNSELEGVSFGQIQKTNKLKGDETWKDLVKNPKKWWDNRLDKKNGKAPDFKHKETGEGLWLSNAPPWALPKLPSSKKVVAVEKRDTLLS